MEYRDDIDSSMVRKLGYDYATKIMLVVFENKDAREYYYHPVEPNTIPELVNAESTGQKFNELIRGNSSIEYVRVGEEVENEAEAYEYFDHEYVDE